MGFDSKKPVHVLPSEYSRRSNINSNKKRENSSCHKFVGALVTHTWTVTQDQVDVKDDT